MDLFNSYLDKQILLNSMANKFANASQEANQFIGNPMQDERPLNAKNTGLPTGNGLGSNTGTGLEDKQFKTRKPAIKDGITQEEKKSVDVDEDGDETMKGVEGGIQASGSVGSKTSSSSSPDPAQQSSGSSSGSISGSSPPAQGFSKHIEGFGEPFKNSRSRKSIVFVPGPTSDCASRV